jgi:hypothetical protein
MPRQQVPASLLANERGLRKAAERDRDRYKAALKQIVGHWGPGGSAATASVSSNIILATLGMIHTVATEALKETRE